jgi:hypothetical protein
MPEPAEDTIVHNLIAALDRLHTDVEKVELWTAALGYFLTPVPEYQPSDQYILPTSPKREAPRPQV